MTAPAAAEKSKIIDALGRKQFVQNIVEHIHKWGVLYEEGSVFSITGSYGSGKSTAVNLLQEQLNEIHGNDGQGIPHVKLDVWQMDYAGHPLGVFVHGLLEELKKYDDTPIKDAVEQFMTAGWGAVKGIMPHLFNGAVHVLTGGLTLVADINLNEVIKDAVNGAKEASTKGMDDSYRLYTHHKEQIEALKRALSELIEHLPHKKLVVIVDELDRARPNFSIELLEIIKHLFNIRGVIFILAIDKGAMAEAIQPIYGKQIFESYFLKFITREFPLPNITNEANFIQLFLNQEILRKTGSHPDSLINTPISKNIATVLKPFGFTLREKEFLLRVFVDAYIEKPNARYIHEINMFYLALSYKNEDAFKEVVASSFNFESVFVVARKLYSSNRALLRDISLGGVTENDVDSFREHLNVNSVPDSFRGNKPYLEEVHTSFNYNGKLLFDN